MNNKLAKAGIAGVAAIALAATGSTFASWSDFGIVEDNSVGAGELVLDLNGGNGSEPAIPVSFGHFAPGEGSTNMRYLASKQGDAVPLADLSVTMKDLVNKDNLCSSNSEALEDTCETEDGGGGEFGAKANIVIGASGPTTAGNCGHVTYTTVYDGTINGLSGNKQTLGQLSNGDGICVKATVTLPDTAPNNTQGDSSEWNWRFDLVQS